ncbi:MAG: L-threonylcarbamoyladenylate synthase [Vicinamibacteraceae bacterium]
MRWGHESRGLVVDPTLDAAALERALVVPASVLDRGGVVAFPTETVYGLAADPASLAAVAKVFDVKGRAIGEPLPLIAADVDAARSVAAVWSAITAHLAATFWPGPLTLLVPVDESQVTPGVTAGKATVGVRVSSHPVARALAAVSPSGLITATSANRSGTPDHATAEAVMAAFAHRVDLVVDGGPSPGGSASTIVDVSEAVPRLIREGPIAFARVLESLR